MTRAMPLAKLRAARLRQVKAAFFARDPAVMGSICDGTGLVLQPHPSCRAHANGDVSIRLTWRGVIGGVVTTMRREWLIERALLDELMPSYTGR